MAFVATSYTTLPSPDAMGVECPRILCRCAIGAFRETAHPRKRAVWRHSPSQPGFRAIVTGWN